jgi:hypothetical protein
MLNFLKIKYILYVQFHQVIPKAKVGNNQFFDKNAYGRMIIINKVE